MAKLRKISDLNQEEQHSFVQLLCDKHFWCFSGIAIGSVSIGPVIGKTFYFFVAVTLIATLNAVVAWLSDHYIALYRNVAVASGRGKKPTKDGCKLMCKRAKTINDWSSFGALCFFVCYLPRLWEVSGVFELLIFCALLSLLYAQHLTLSLADEVL